MTTTAIQDLAAFHRFVGEKLRFADPALSPERVFDEWQSLQSDDALSEGDLAAIQEAIDDIGNGDRGISADEFYLELQAIYHLPNRS